MAKPPSQINTVEAPGIEGDSSEGNTGNPAGLQGGDPAPGGLTPAAISRDSGGLTKRADDSDAVEAALAAALAEASAAGRWDVVGQLARELEARRLASSGGVVVSLAARRR